MKAASAAATVAFQYAPASKTNAPAAALAAAKAEAASSLQPRALSTECGVCYAAFNTLAPSSDSDPPLVLRCHMRLCGHNAICSDCFTAYLESRIKSDDCMPYLTCPEPGCKLTLTQADLVADVPTPQSVRLYESQFLRDEAHRAARNNAAWDAMHAAVLKLDTKDQNARKGKSAVKKAVRKLESATKTPLNGASSASNSNSSNDDEEDDSDSSDDGSNSASASAPIAPSLASEERTPILSTPMLQQLVILHMSKLLARCKEWLPCGTFTKLKEEAAAEAQVDSTESAAVASINESKEDSAPASAFATSTPSSSTDACRFGFLLVPPLFLPYAKTDKLKKCSHCGLLQKLKLKDSPSSSGSSAKPDPELEKMLADGSLRPCPICSALQMKDHGMCNVLQCHQCQIFWNWQSRDTGKNEAALKDRARMTGSLWEPGQLAASQRLEREDPEAFKALLARNGIVYNPNYVRGGH